MSCLIRIVYEVELGNWEDAAKLCADLKKSKASQDLAGLEEALAFLREVISAGSKGGGFPAFGDQLNERLAALGRALEGQWLLHAFDLLGWVEARRRGIPLLSLFKQRGSSGS